VAFRCGQILNPIRKLKARRKKRRHPI